MVCFEKEKWSEERRKWKMKKNSSYVEQTERKGRNDTHITSHTHTKRFNYTGEHAPSLSFLPLPHAQTRTNPGKRQCTVRYRAMFTTFVVLCLVERETSVGVNDRLFSYPLSCLFAPVCMRLCPPTRTFHDQRPRWRETGRLRLQVEKKRKEINAC